MTFRIAVLLVALLVVAPGGAFAGGNQDGTLLPAYEKYPQALGFQGGEIGGTGLSYQRWDGEIGIQFAAGGIYVPYNSGETARWSAFVETTLDYVVGAEFQYQIFGEAFANWLTGQLYLFAGLNHRGYIPLEIVSDVAAITGQYTPVISFGAGIGIEIILVEHFSIPVEIGYGVLWSPTIPGLANQFEVNLMPQAGFRYRY